MVWCVFLPKSSVEFNVQHHHWRILCLCFTVLEQTEASTNHEEAVVGSAGDATYLEDLRKEARANLLTEEVIDAGQAGHGTPQGSIWGRPDAVGCVDTVKRGLIWTPMALFGVAEEALRVVVHGTGGSPIPQADPSHRETKVCVRSQQSWGRQWWCLPPSWCQNSQTVSY